MNKIRILPQDNLISLGNYTLNGFDLDETYKSYHGFIDIAAFGLEDPVLGSRLMAAIVPQPGKSPNFNEFIAYLESLKISPAKFPEKLVTVAVIPRDDRGIVNRGDILSTL